MRSIWARLQHRLFFCSLDRKRTAQVCSRDMLVVVAICFPLVTVFTHTRVEKCTQALAIPFIDLVFSLPVTLVMPSYAIVQNRNEIPFKIDHVFARVTVCWEKMVAL